MQEENYSSTDNIFRQPLALRRLACRVPDDRTQSQLRSCFDGNRQPAIDVPF
jgi:hypothetical protein